MNTVDLKSVMGWNPCEDFPKERIAALFGNRNKVTITDMFAVSMRQDEYLWVALREAWFSPEELKNMAARFVLHVGDLAGYNDPIVTNSVLNATLASLGSFEMLPKNDRRHQRWEKGATEAERRAGLSALWAASARADTETNKEKRTAKWNKERDWQVQLVKKKAGI